MKKKIKVKDLRSRKMVRRIMATLRERKLFTGHLTDEQLLILTHAVIQTIIFTDTD